MNTSKTFSGNSTTGQAVIIAAGESRRFWPLAAGHKHKTQLRLLGKPIIYWTVKGLVENGITNITVVRSPHSDLQEVLEKENDLGAKFSFVVQEIAKGSGDALWQAREKVTGPFIALWPNKVNSKELIATMLQEQRNSKADVVFVGAPTDRPQEYGMVQFQDEKQEKTEAIIENPEPGKEPSNIKAVGAYILPPDFFAYYEKVEHGEADFIDALNACMKEKNVSLVRSEKDVPTLKYPWELFQLFDFMLEAIPLKGRRGKDVQIGKNVIIENEEKVYIGNNVKIQANTVIEGPAYIGDNCIIGHANVLRGPLNLEANCMTGAFMEIKHSIVQRNTHFHSGYLGDSLVGEECRFGAGFISANKRFDRAGVKVEVGGEKIETGLDALGCVVGDKTAFGIHSGTMPGILVAPDSVINPGTQVSNTVRTEEK